MSGDGQAVIVGRLVIEHKRKPDLLHTLKVRAAGIGPAVAQIGQTLERDPAYLAFQGHNVDARFVGRESSSPGVPDFKNNVHDSLGPGGSGAKSE